MIAVEELIYDIDLRTNKVATSAHQHIPLEDKLIALNEAQLLLIKQKLSVNNLFQGGLDSFKKRYDDLQAVITPHKPLVLIKDKASVLPRYTANLADLPSGFLFYVDCYFLCEKGPCKNHMVTGRRIKHADLQAVMANSNTAPSFEYQEMPLTISDNILECYTDGSFQAVTAHISYVRYPYKIDMEGYFDFDGNPSINTNCELAYYLKDELVNMAVASLAMNTENQSAVQAAQLRAAHNE